MFQITKRNLKIPITHKRCHVKNAAQYTQCPQHYMSKNISAKIIKMEQQKLTQCCQVGLLYQTLVWYRTIKKKNASKLVLFLPKKSVFLA